MSHSSCAIISIFVKPKFWILKHNHISCQQISPQQTEFLKVINTPTSHYDTNCFLKIDWNIQLWLLIMLIAYWQMLFSEITDVYCKKSVLIVNQEYYSYVKVHIRLHNKWFQMDNLNMFWVINRLGFDLKTYYVGFVVFKKY